MTVRPFPLRGPGHTGTVPGVALLSRPIGGLPEPSGHQTHLQTGEQGDLPDAGTLPRPGSAALLTRCQGRCRPAGAKQPRLLQTGEAQGPGLHPQSWGGGGRDGMEMKDHGTTSNTVSTGQQSGGGTFRTSKRPLQCQYPTHTLPRLQDVPQGQGRIRRHTLMVSGQMALPRGRGTAQARPPLRSEVLTFLS